MANPSCHCCRKLSRSIANVVKLRIEWERIRRTSQASGKTGGGPGSSRQINYPRSPHPSRDSSSVNKISSSSIDPQAKGSQDADLGLAGERYFSEFKEMEGLFRTVCQGMMGEVEELIKSRGVPVLVNEHGLGLQTEASSPSPSMVEGRVEALESRVDKDVALLFERCERGLPTMKTSILEDIEERLKDLVAEFPSLAKHEELSRAMQNVQTGIKILEVQQTHLSQAIDTGLLNVNGRVDRMEVDLKCRIGNIEERLPPQKKVKTMVSAFTVYVSLTDRYSPLPSVFVRLRVWGGVRR